MATIGEVLSQPEEGWRRYDDTNINFIYTGTWGSSSITTLSYGSTGRWSGDGAVGFKFYGTKLRIISTKYTNRDITRITIDGVDYTYSEYTSGSQLYQILLFEKIDLALGIHEITIKKNDSSSSYQISLDAIDIDANGYLIHPYSEGIEENNLADMEIGDFISCKYTALTSGQPGYFSELGTCAASDIPVSGSATPNGKFNFIKADRGLLIADRVVQHSISWDTLRSAGFIEGNPKYDGLYFNGINSYINIPYNAKLYPATAITIKIVFEYKERQSSVEQRLICCNEAGGYTIYENTMNFGFQAYINGGYKSISVPKASLQEGIHEIIATFDGRYLKIYTDGVLRGTNDIGATYSITYNTVNLMIGADPDKNGVGNPPYYYEGTIYKASVWNVALSESQILQYYNKELVGNETGLVSAWDFNWSSPNTLFDKSVNKFNGTMYNITPVLSNENILIRSLSGGVAYADENGNMSVTERGFGGFSRNNDWDKYIVNSDLNEKIAKGDNKIWNWMNMLTHCKDTVVANFTQSDDGTVTNNPSTQRMRIGFSRIDTRKFLGTSTTTDTTGFRPVLEYIEPDGSSKQTNLWY